MLYHRAVLLLTYIGDRLCILEASHLNRLCADRNHRTATESIAWQNVIQSRCLFHLNTSLSLLPRALNLPLLITLKKITHITSPNNTDYTNFPIILPPLSLTASGVIMHGMPECSSCCIPDGICVPRTCNYSQCSIIVRGFSPRFTA